MPSVVKSTRYRLSDSDVKALSELYDVSEERVREVLSNSADASTFVKNLRFFIENEVNFFGSYTLEIGE